MQVGENGMTLVRRAQETHADMTLASRCFPYEAHDRKSRRETVAPRQHARLLVSKMTAGVFLHPKMMSTTGWAQVEVEVIL